MVGRMSLSFRLRPTVLLPLPSGAWQEEHLAMYTSRPPVWPIALASRIVKETVVMERTLRIARSSHHLCWNTLTTERLAGRAGRPVTPASCGTICSVHKVLLNEDEPDL